MPVRAAGTRRVPAITGLLFVVILCGGCASDPPEDVAADNPPRRYDPGYGPDSPDTDTLLDELVVRNREGTAAQRAVMDAGDPGASADVRRRALSKIVNSTVGGEAVYVDLYRVILREPDTDPTVAAAAALGLAAHGSPADAQLVVPLLESSEGYTRWQAAVALQRLHDPDAVPALATALADDDDADARMAAAAALGQYPQRPAFDALLAALDDQDSGVARAALRSLQHITGHTAGDDPAAWLAYADANVATLFADAEPARYWKYPGPPPWWVKLLLPWTTRDPMPVTPLGYTPPTPTDEG